MKKIFFLSLTAIVLSAFFYNCSFQKMSKNLGSGLGEGVSTKTDTIGHTLIAGIRDEITTDASQKKISRFIDSLMAAFSNSLNPKLKGLRDSLLNEKIIQWADSLLETMTGKHLRTNMGELQKILVGRSLAEMKNALHDLFLEILSDDTKEKIGQMRDELLGAKTDSAISHIVDHAMTAIANRYKSDLDPTLKKDVSFITKHATSLLLTLGGIAAVIIFWVWWNKRKYLRMVTLLSKNIHDIPDETIYNVVTAKIKDQAVQAGLEPSLRKILDKNKLVGTEAWKNNMEKKKALQSTKL